MTEEPNGSAFFGLRAPALAPEGWWLTLRGRHSRKKSD